MSFSNKFAQIFVSTFTILNVRVSPWEKILAQQTLSTGQTKFHRSLSLEGFYLCFFCIAIKYCQHIFENVIVLKPELIYVANITNYIHGEKIVMWRNFSFPCMMIVGKLKISPHVEKYQKSPHDRCGQKLRKKMTNMRSALDSHWFALLSNDLGGCYYARLVLGVPLPSVICSPLAISNNLMTSGEKMTNCRFGFNTPWKEGKGSNTWVTIFLYLRGTLHH